jgi:hypothetical protein
MIGIYLLLSTGKKFNKLWNVLKIEKNRIPKEGPTQHN